MEKNNKEFSKILLIQESILVWILTLSFIGLAFYCIKCGYTGSLPWLAAMVSFPWGAYGVSQVYYYKKSMKENCRDGVKFESVMAEVNSTYGQTNADIFSETDNLDNNYNPDIDYGI